MRAFELMIPQDVLFFSLKQLYKIRQNIDTFEKRLRQRRKGQRKS